MRRRIPLLLAALAATGCSSGDPGPDSATPANRVDTPVALDPVPPMEYPPDLYQQRVEGTVMLRLYVNEAGNVVAESTQVAESSGYPAFDSAAVAGVPRMRFAPAQRDGRPVATSFTQPVHFRLPDQGGRRP